MHNFKINKLIYNEYKMEKPMNLLEIIFLAIALAMDATAVAMVDGLNTRSMKLKLALLIAITFAIFQGLLPLIGYFAGSIFSDYFGSLSHIIGSAILLLLGINMIRESDKDDEEQKTLCFKIICIQGIATSIDALVAGVTCAVLGVQMIYTTLIIVAITFTMCFIGIYIGKKFGKFFSNKANLIGGVILILMGLDIILTEIL